MLLAQLNIAHMLEPIDSPAMASFVELIDEVNARAERAPGFVWRLRFDGRPGSLEHRIFDDDTLLVNMSVWADSQSLFDLVYRDEEHRGALRRRHEWFGAVTDATTVCWWVKEGHLPTVREAQDRLVLLRENGPSVEAFAFQRTIPSYLRPLPP